jgi:hypothetical protein
MPDDHDLEKLRILYSLREYFHKALWEEEKHFTWLLSLIATGQATLLANAVPLQNRLLLLGVLSGLGLVITLLALKVVRAESDNFQQLLWRFVRVYNQLFYPKEPDSEERFREPGREANSPYRTLVNLSWTGKLKIRDAFQCIYLVFAVANCILLYDVLLEMLLGLLFGAA